MRILGVDPGLQRTGWGVIDTHGNRLSYVACGVVKSRTEDDLSFRLKTLSDQLAAVLAEYRPQTAALEETFVNVNAQSTLKLGQARGAILLTLAQGDLHVAEYAPRLVKKALTGSGSADKTQISAMLGLLLPGVTATADAADALAIAICHAHHGATGGTR